MYISFERLCGGSCQKAFRGTDAAHILLRVAGRDSHVVSTNKKFRLASASLCRHSQPLVGAYHCICTALKRGNVDVYKAVV